MIYAADFETNNYENDCYVYLWGVMDLDGNMVHGNTIKSFFKHIKSLNAEKIYFHNLKFDMSFMVNYMLNNGYVQEKKVFNYKKKQMELPPKSFNVGVDKLGNVFFLDIGFPGGRQVRCLDFLKILNMPLSKIPKTLGIDKEVKKGVYDYDLFRQESHTPTDLELDYLKSDLDILRHGLLFMIENDIHQITFASYSFSSYKAYVGEGFYNKHFPPQNKMIYDEMIKAYKGGYTYLAKKSGYIHEGVCIYDINSLYPFILSKRLMPYGEPLYFSGQYKEDSKHPLYIQRFSCSFKLKKGFVPTIQIKDMPGVFKATEYIKVCYDVVELNLTNIDLNIFFNHYEVYDITYIGGFKFAGSDKMFHGYLSHNNTNKIKYEEAGNTGLRNLYKLKSNSLYGKFGENPQKEVMKAKLDEKKILHYVIDEIKEENGQYLPVALFTTAWARAYIIDMIDVLKDQFIYCDTDSVHFYGDIPKKLIELTHATKLGYYKCEHKSVKAKYLGAKTYMLEDNNELIVKGIGMKDDIKKQVTFDNFNIGTVYHGSKRAKNVPGGVVITESEFIIRKR